MNVTGLIVTSLVLALSFTPVFSVAGAEAQNIQFQDSGSFLVADSGIYEQKTCSGRLAAPRPETYVFGLRSDTNGCSTRTYLANDYEEALGCARKSCPNCEIEDITWLSRFSSSVTDISDYCPARK